jgi:hypothetical protein
MFFDAPFAQRPLSDDPLILKTAVGVDCTF